jgi:hypothetical protein
MGWLPVRADREPSRGAAVLDAQVKTYVTVGFAVQNRLLACPGAIPVRGDPLSVVVARAHITPFAAFFHCILLDFRSYAAAAAQASS